MDLRGGHRCLAHPLGLTVVIKHVDGIGRCLADAPRIRATLYRFVPTSGRPRAILVGDEIFAKLGDYVLGNVVTSVIAGAATVVWCVIFDVPYALLLGAVVAIPVAAALQLVTQELLFPALDKA